jgi:hypothetical protein
VQFDTRSSMDDEYDCMHDVWTAMTQCTPEGEDPRATTAEGDDTTRNDETQNLPGACVPLSTRSPHQHHPCSLAEGTSVPPPTRTQYRTSARSLRVDGSWHMDSRRVHTTHSVMVSLPRSSHSLSLAMT